MFRLLLIAVVLFSPGVVYAQIELPDIPLDGIYDAIESQTDELLNLPENILAPDGVSLLPGEDGRIIFGYIKWLTAVNITDELFGPFSTIFFHIGIYLLVQFVLNSVYFIVFGISYILSWAVALFRLVLDVVKAAAAVVGAASNFVGGIIGKIIKFFTG